MRVIKFRGKDNHSNWVFGGVTADKKHIVDRWVLIPVNPYTVGQFTELRQ